VQKPNGDVVSYTYDTDGIRVSSTVNGVTTQYLVDKNRDYAQVLEEYQDGDLLAEYVYGNDLISQERGTDKSFYLVDGLGSTRGLTDEGGSQIAAYNYDAFGNLLTATGSVENNYLFAGEQFDPLLGNYYLRARFYDPETGRFTERDLFKGFLTDPISLHKYLYTHANPVNESDPTGLLSLNELNVAQKIFIILLSTVAITAVSLRASITSLSPQQRQSMVNSKYTQYIPFVREDKKYRGCFSAEVPRRGFKIEEDFQDNAFVYATQVSGSEKDFFVIAPNAVAATFDGRTPGTRNVWESKYGYEMMNQVSFLRDRQLLEFEKERDRQIIVAGMCMYNLQWAFSNEKIAEIVRDKWSNVPPILYIPYV